MINMGSRKSRIIFSKAPPLQLVEFSELVWIDVNRIFKASKMWKILSLRLKRILNMLLFHSKKGIIWEIFLLVCIVGFHHRNFGIPRNKRLFQPKQVFGELLRFLRNFLLHTTLLYESTSIIGLLSQKFNWMA